ncbi:glycosyltransferase [Aeromonas salmonicida]|uniref:glycosyltransferase n=1 Tax=Aeromonas salmonicida TaxID=645 RepID=UPI00125EA741|nr:glycosyltransferase [Aeromonas salmonicida]HEG4446350.1 glycosyltransferase family 4 protein [Aeromonas hydrophila]
MSTLIIISTNVVGGHEAQVVHIANALSEMQEDVTILCGNDDVKMFFQSQCLNSTVEYSKKIRLMRTNIIFQLCYSIFLFFRIVGLVNGYKKIIISAGAVEASAPYVILSIVMRNVYLYLPAINFRPNFFGFLYNPFIVFTLFFFEKIIAINKVQAKVFNSILPAKVLVIRNLISNKILSESLSSGTRSRVFFIGRVDKNKRVLQAVQWLDCPESGVDDILIFGNGTELKNIQSYKSEYVNIVCYGWLPFDEIADRLNKNDILLINSVSEGEPTIIREMRYCGISVLSRNILGVRGVTNKQSRFDDAKSLLKCIASLSIVHQESTRKREGMIEQYRLRQIKRFLND